MSAVRKRRMTDDEKEVARNFELYEKATVEAGYTIDGEPVLPDGTIIENSNHKEEIKMSSQQALATVGPAEIMERVIAVGDLSKLTPGERNSYYLQVCQSIGLNPLTRPFEYIILNGKLTLYTRKDATEQLRKLNNVSLNIVGRERMVGDAFCVTARAKMPNGRVDESLGVVSLGGLKGAELANAMMKAETKAKRRVTLSICGLGFLDESEVADVRQAEGEDLDLDLTSSPIAMPSQRVEAEEDDELTTPIPKSPSAPTSTSAAFAPNNDPITEGQIKILRTKMKNAVLADSDLCDRFGITALGELTKGQMNDALDWIKDPA